MATATLQKHVECPVCFEVFSNPHTLQCLHTYCLECLESLQKASGQIECPECRKITHFKDLKKDFRAEGMIDSFAQLEKGIVKDLSCLGLHVTPSTKKCVCNNVSKPVVGHCEDCEVYLCSDCKAAHLNLKITRTHKIQGIADMITALRQDVHNASDDILQDINSIDLKSTQIDSKIQNIVADKMNKLAEVHRVLDSLIEAIEKHRKTLFNKITEAYDGLVKKLSTKQEKLKNNRLVLQSWFEYLKNVMKSDNVAILSNVITLHGTTLVGNGGEVAEIRNYVKKMHITTKSGMRLVTNDDVMDLKSIIDVEMAEGFNAAHLEATDKNGFRDLINCKYKVVVPEYCNNGYRYSLWDFVSISLINNEFWCGFVNEIAIYDKNRNLVKKMSYKQLEKVEGISHTHRGEIIASCSSGLHQLDSTGNYVMKLKEGNFGRSFTVGEEVYVVDADKSNVLTLKHVNGVWKSMNEISLTFDARNILVTESGIYIWSEWFESDKYHCVYHYSLSGDLLQQVDIPQPRDGSIPSYFSLHGVDSYGNMLTSYLVDSDEKVQIFTCEKQWLDVPFLEEQLEGDSLHEVWCQGDEVFVVLSDGDDYSLTVFTKE